MSVWEVSMKLKRLALFGGLAAITACVPQPKTPPPPPAPRPAPPPVRPVQPPPPPADWRDIPLTPGAWTYRQMAGGSEARYGAGEPALFVVRCDKARGAVELIREAARTAPSFSVRTSFGVRSFPTSGGVAAVQPRDSFLDGIAFSRGRFTVESPGLPMLVIPSWPEPARVIEDCRS
jgi:hypothetical protein